MIWMFFPFYIYFQTGEINPVFKMRIQLYTNWEECRGSRYKIEGFRPSKTTEFWT